MSQAVFPVLPGLAWNVTRTPQWNTRVQKTVGGSELRASYYSQPIRRYQLTYDVLRATTALQELQTLVGFFNARQGSYDSFLYDDPIDDSVTSHGFGVGDGTTTAFQLQRTAAGPRTDWQGTLPVPTTPRTNLLQSSQDFSQSQWVAYYAKPPVVSGILDPSGGTGAQRFATCDSSGSPANYSGVYQAGSYTGTITVHVWARCVSGTLGVSFGPDDGHTQPFTLTTTWHHLVVTATGTFARLFEIYETTANNPAWELYAPQAESGSAATAYVPTPVGATAYATPAYWPATADSFEPVYNPKAGPTLYRQDWQGNQQVYATARTNLVLYSEQFDNAAWVKNGSTITANATTAPDGNATADKLCEAAVTGTHYASETFSGLADNQSYTLSVFAKAAERTWVAIEGVDKAGAAKIGYFNLSAGTWGTVSGGATVAAALVGNGWWRLSITFNANTGASTPAVYVFTATGDNGASYAGTAGSGLYVWGAQLEAAAAWTAYVPTTTAAVTVTDYTLANGLVTFAVAPLAGAALTWTGGYYWRCRFEKDMQEFNNFLYQLWEAKSVAFVTVKGS